MAAIGRCWCGPAANCPPANASASLRTSKPKSSRAASEPTSAADQYLYTGSTGPSISAVGTLAFKAGTNTTSIALSPQHVGDLLVLFAKDDATGITVSSVSGGGVSTWTRAGSYSGYANHDLEIWTGTVSTVGAATATVTFSASVASTYTGLASEEFSATTGTNTQWSVDTSGGISNTASTSVTFPKLAPGGTGELYFAYDAVANTASTGTTSGFTYATTSDGDVASYDVNVSAAGGPPAQPRPRA